MGDTYIQIQEEKVTVQNSGDEVQIISQGATRLASLTDVDISSLADGDFIQYQSSSGKWENVTASVVFTSLGLGTIATQDADSVAITGGSIGGITATGSFNFADFQLIRPELKDYAETRPTPSSSSNTLTLDLTTGNVFEVTLTENVTTLTISNPPATGKGGSFTLILKQNGSGGHTFNWPASLRWASGNAPTLTTAANAVDILTFITTDAGTTWYGFLAGGDMQP